MKNILLKALIPFLFISCVKTRDYTINDGLSPNDIIRISSINPIEAFADSSSEIVVRVEINRQSSGNQPITLTTTQGIINNATKSEIVTTNTNRYVDFKLKTGQTPGPVFLKATVLSDYSRDTIINFIKAYPDLIIIDPVKFTMEKNTSLAININLLRFKGYPSAAQNILYSVVSDNGEKVGTLTSFDPFRPGSITVATFTPNADYTGAAFIIVTVLKADGSKIESKVKITVL